MKTPPFAKRLSAALVAAFFLSAGFALADGENEAELDRVVVTGSRVISGPDIGKPSRSVDRSEMEWVAAGAAAEALDRLPGVAVSERGSASVQADVSIRGSSFEQTLITLFGLPVSDPQTGHHNMDLPVPLLALERIEVVPGPVSGVFGPSAMAGVVEVTPVIPDRNGAAARFAGGGFSTRSAEALVMGREGEAAGLAAVSYEDSAGFMAGTDYVVWSAWTTAIVGPPDFITRVSAGHVEKDFGAQDFYAEFPSRERTAMTMVDLAPDIRIGDGARLELAARYRRHYDEFVLFEDDPDFYRNRHTSSSGLGRVALRLENGQWRASLGYERQDHLLESSSLGDRRSFLDSVFYDQSYIAVSGGMLQLGIRADRHSEWGWRVSPYGGGSLPLGERLWARAAAGSGFRPPSFTELYYRDPLNVGDSGLDPESAWGAEFGLDYFASRGLVLSATYFYSYTEDAITWTRESEFEPWRAGNLGEVKSSGIEAELSSRDRHLPFRLFYCYLDQDADLAGFESKYALNHPRHDAGAGLGLEEDGFSVWADLRYREVPRLANYWLGGVVFSYRRDNYLTHFKLTNLLDSEYQEIPGVPTPGRAFELGIRLEF